MIAALLVAVAAGRRRGRRPGLPLRALARQGRAAPRGLCRRTPRARSRREAVPGRRAADRPRPLPRARARPLAQRRRQLRHARQLPRRADRAHRLGPARARCGRQRVRRRHARRARAAPRTIGPACDVWLIASGAEERPYTGQADHLGARAAVPRVRSAPSDLRFVLSLDEVGRGTNVPPALAGEPAARRGPDRQSRPRRRPLGGRLRHGQLRPPRVLARRAAGGQARRPRRPAPPHRGGHAVTAPAARVHQSPRDRRAAPTLTCARGRHDPLRGEPHPARARGPRARTRSRRCTRASAATAGPSGSPGQAVRSVDAHGKHLFLRFEGGLTIHSHLRMTGSWRVLDADRRPSRAAWLAIRARRRAVVQFKGPVLELMTDSRTRIDQRIAGLGPDILAPEFDYEPLPPPPAPGRPDAPDRRRRARAEDGRGDRQPVEGGGVLGRADRPVAPHRRRLRRRGGRDRRRRPAAHAGVRARRLQQRNQQVYNRAGRPCPRCGTPIQARGQWDDNRTTYWCPGCQR